MPRDSGAFRFWATIGWSPGSVGLPFPRTVSTTARIRSAGTGHPSDVPRAYVGAFRAIAVTRVRENNCSIAPTPRREPSAAPLSARRPMRRRSGRVSVSAAPDECGRKSCGYRCRCSWCSGTRDREAISSLISVFALCDTHIQPDRYAKLVPPRQVSLRSRGLASVDGLTQAANVNRVDTYTAVRLRTSCVAPFCVPDVRLRTDDERREARVDYCDNPRDQLRSPLHVDLS